MQNKYFLGLSSAEGKNGDRWYAAWILSSDRWGNPQIKRRYMSKEQYDGIKNGSIQFGAPVSTSYDDDGVLQSIKQIDGSVLKIV